MREVKFHKGLSKVYGISRSEFLEATKESEPYMQYVKGKKEAFALCPFCENPVKLLGVYARLEKQSPHARHFKNDIPGLANYDEYKYLQCPYHKENAIYITEARSRKDITDFNKEILALAHDYFDKCIYILRKTTGLVISDKLAEEIEVDPFFFNKLIHSRNARAPRKELVDIADRILVLETNEKNQ